MGIVRQSRSFAPAGETAVTAVQRNDSMSIIEAASSMTASGVMLSHLRNVEVDEDTKKYFRDFQGITDPSDVSTSHWNGIKRSAVTTFLPQMQERREKEHLPRMTPKEIRYLAEADSFDQFARRKSQIDRVAASYSMFQDNTMSVFGASMAISMIEPWNIASMPLALVKAGSRAVTAARMSGIGMGIAGAEEAVLRQDDPNRTLGVSLASVAIAGTINGAIGSYLSRTKAVQEAHLGEIKARIESIDNEGKVVIDLDNDMLDPASETINLNLINSARELNQLLADVPGVGIKTAEKILARRASRPEDRFDSLDDLLDDSTDLATRARVQNLIDSKKFHVSSASNPTISSSDEIVGAFGIEKIAGITAPLVRLMRSPFPEVRRSAKELMDTPFLTTDNLKNIPSPVALESVVNANRKLGNDLVDDLEGSYYSYLFPEGTGSDFAKGRGGRLFRQAGQVLRNISTRNFDQLKRSPTGITGKKSFDEFKLAVLEHHTGARLSDDINVKSAAKSFKAFFKSKEEEVRHLLLQLRGGDPTKLRWITKTNYTHRIYNKNVIAGNPKAFEEFLVAQAINKHGSLRNVETELGAGIAEIRTSFRKSIDRLVRSPEERINLQKVFAVDKRGAEHNRFWTFIDDADLYRTDFVVKDLEAISNSYISSVLADVSFYKKYGTLNTKEIVDPLRAKIHGRLDLDDDQVVELEKSLDLLESMMERVRGVYLDPLSPVPGGTKQSVIDSLKKWNNLRLGAGFTIKSLPDIGRSIMFLGVGGAYAPLFRANVLRNKEALSFYKRSSAELKRINVANEINFSSIISTMTNTHINSFSGNKITDAIGKANNSMFILNGLSLWNNFMKKNAGIGVLDQIVSSAKSLKAGKLDAKKAQNLLKLGIDEDDLRRVLVEFEKHGESYKGVHLMNFENWSDAANLRTGPLGLSLADRIQLAVKKEVDTIIVTPGIGDIPLIMENSWVSLFAQYRSFPIAAVVRQTLPLAQNMNGNAFAGLLVGISAAFAAKQFTDYARGIDHGEDDWGVVLWEALEDTGNLSTIGEFSNYAQMISSGNPMVMGPLGTVPQDVFKVQQGLANEEGMSPYEIRAAMRLMPFAGLIQMLSALPKAAGETATFAYKEIQDGL